jgi:methylmalonyl-CoA mutase N-terminal domain/subunit
VNKFTEEAEPPIDVLQIDETAEQKQIERIREVRRRRNESAVAKTLSDLRRAAEGSENTMPFILDAVRAYATVGEICGALKEVFGSYTETNVL